MYEIEITDTFGGESNYSWVKRGVTRLRGRRWAVRPEGQLGTCGWSPCAWTVIYVNASNAAEAVRKAMK
jgi:hypothetical protein